MYWQYTLVDPDRGYIPNIEIPGWLIGRQQDIAGISNSTGHVQVSTEWFKNISQKVWESAMFKRILPQNVIQHRVQSMAHSLIAHHGSDLKNLQVFVLANGGFIFGKMLFDALSSIHPENLPRFFSFRTATYEGTNISEKWVRIDTNSASHVDFALKWDVTEPRTYQRWLLYNEQLSYTSPVLILDDVFDSGHTIDAVIKHLSRIFPQESIGTMVLAEKPSGLVLPRDPRSPKAYNSSGVVVLGTPWLAWWGMNAWVGTPEDEKKSRIGWEKGGIWMRA